MPFLNTTPATGGGGMLSNEKRVTSHWSLFTIVFWILGRYSCGYEIDSVLPDCIDKVAQLFTNFQILFCYLLNTIL
jgi:hypothetical protein